MDKEGGREGGTERERERETIKDTKNIINSSMEGQSNKRNAATQHRQQKDWQRKDQQLES